MMTKNLYLSETIVDMELTFGGCLQNNHVVGLALQGRSHRYGWSGFHRTTFSVTSSKSSRRTSPPEGLHVPQAIVWNKRALALINKRVLAHVRSVCACTL